MIRRKIADEKGETLIETLAAVLICCLALAALASVMLSAGKVMSSSGAKLESYYSCNEVLSNPGDEPGESGKVRVRLGGTEIKLSPESEADGYAVEFYVNAGSGNRQVTAYYAG